jgi:acetyl-CoA acyltransferase 1
VTVTEDDGIRHNAAIENFSKAKSAFPQWGEGKSTGPNSSQVTDGGAAVVLMKRARAEELGLEILGKHVATSVIGVPPRHMGIGPAFAIPKVLESVGITKDEVDLWEINEAFSSMYVYCLQQLDLDIAKVNVNGGAIALGHPLGATGVRQVVTGLAELGRRGERVLVSSMCIGSGMGAAAIFVNERI